MNEAQRREDPLDRLVIYRQRYDKDVKWRKRWSDLANNIEVRRAKYPLQVQQEYIEHRAHLANMRIAKLMHNFDLGI